MYDEKKFKKYLKGAEDFFIEKRGTPFILSPEDVQLILFWFKREVPLEVVKKGIEEVFEKLKERDPEKKINTIKYCAQRIEEIFRENQKSKARSWHKESAKIDILSSLNKNMENLKEFFKDKTEYKNQYEKFLKKIEELKKMEDLEEIEDNLKKVEEKIIEIFYKKIDKEEKEKLKNEVEKTLPPEVKLLPAHTKNSLIKTIIMEKIKREKNIPSLTLLL